MRKAKVKDPLVGRPAKAKKRTSSTTSISVPRINGAIHIVFEDRATEHNPHPEVIVQLTEKPDGTRHVTVVDEDNVMKQKADRIRVSNIVSVSFDEMKQYLHNLTLK